VGAVTRQKEIRQRRTRQRKRRHRRLRELARALQKGRTHVDRVRIAEERREKWASQSAQA
jgi:Na+/phosphate symporter